MFYKIENRRDDAEAAMACLASKQYCRVALYRRGNSIYGPQRALEED